MIVAKFGGSSMANAGQILKVLDIIRSDRERNCIVVSAPGKYGDDDQKITDLLYQWHSLHARKLNTAAVKDIIRRRFQSIVEVILPEFNPSLGSELATIESEITSGASPDYVASRGEYLIGMILAEALGYEFVDAARCINFDASGRYVRDDALIYYLLEGRDVVIPGFYGSMPDGTIKTFSRGGSDITGAIIARAMGAEVYENWTDVPGLLSADPRIVQNPRGIREVTYRELRELAFGGAEVFHPDAVLPVSGSRIPTNIRNTNDPDHPGTRITSNGIKNPSEPVVGIAGRKGFTVITISKAMMNEEMGFARSVLEILVRHKVSFEHMPGGIDSLSLIIDSKQLGGHKLAQIVADIERECYPDAVEFSPGLGLIVVVGRTMLQHTGLHATLFTAMAKAGIKVRIVNQGSSGISLIIGVDDADYENAVRALYSASVSS
jgi:aspartate kinase